MKIVQLPYDILRYIFEFTSEHIPISCVNKEFYKLVEQELKKQKKRALDKKSFLVNKCGMGTDRSWLHNAFHNVTTLEECEFVGEVYSHGFDLLKKQVHYTVGNSFQLAAETWTLFLFKYMIKT